jgi:molybdenum cofactor biosynthesis protein MoaC
MHLLPAAPHHTSGAYSNFRAYTTSAQEATVPSTSSFTYTKDNNVTIPLALASSSAGEPKSRSDSCDRMNNTTESDPRSRKFEIIQTPVHDAIEHLEAQLPFWRKELWYVAANIKADDPMAQYSIQVDQNMLDWWVREFSRCRNQGLSRLSVGDIAGVEEDSVDLVSSFAEEALQNVKSAEEVVEEQEEDPFWRARFAIRELQRKVLRRDIITQAEEGLERWKRENLAQRSRDLYFFLKDVDDRQAARSVHRLSKVSSEMLKEAVEEFKTKRRRLWKVRNWSEEMEKNKAMRKIGNRDEDKRTDKKRKIVDGGNTKERPSTHSAKEVEDKVNFGDTVTISKSSGLTKNATFGYGNLWKPKVSSEADSTDASFENEAYLTSNPGKSDATAKELISNQVVSPPFQLPNAENPDENVTKYTPSKTDKSVKEILPQTQAKTGARLTHLNDASEAHMVNVGGKQPTHRSAIATGMVSFSDPSTYDLIKSAQIVKGDVLSVARIAGIMAAKNCPSLIPLCHPIALTSVEVDVLLLPPPKFSNRNQYGSIEIEVRVECVGPTGVEMEALTAVAGASLTVIDMIKAVDRRASIGSSRVVLKKGGRSGDWEDEKWRRTKEAQKKHKDTMIRVARAKNY